MSLHPSLLPVKKIKSNQARSTFSPDAIEQAAKAILDAEGTINPLVVRQLSFQEFEVIDGHLEYYAAVRAKELDLVKGEMIDAIVVPPEKESAILEQVRLLRAEKEAKVMPSPLAVASDLTMLEQRLSNLEKQIENQLSELNRRLLDFNQQSSQRNLQEQIADAIHATISTVFKEQLSTIVQQIVQEVGTSRKRVVVPVEELEEKVKSEGYEQLSAEELKTLARGRELKGRSKYKTKAALIAFMKQSTSK
ncbi:ParB N-terminal domain-containing protein [Leptolyngbya sp. AN03gr2]|uniref:ParB N-terminal domain-containing protein n=1 Tax=unclassified Leptolyngbya TaxID=2650499 RepID=UPI003D316296